MWTSAPSHQGVTSVDLLADHHHNVTLIRLGAEAAHEDVAIMIGGNVDAGLVEAVEIVQPRDGVCPP